MRMRLLAALLLAFGLTFLFAAPALAEGPAPVTDLHAQKSGTSVILTWSHSADSVVHYEVWWSDSPYAAIDDAGMVKIADVAPGTPPIQVTYTDTASGVGNTAVNSFYAVRGVTAGGEASVLSNRAGEFDFGMNGIKPTLPVVDYCGTISADEVWGPNAVHRLTCDVTVATGGKLTVLAGTKIQASSSVALNIYGNLIAQGSADHPITFTNLTGDETGEKWQGLYLAGSATVDHIIVEYTSYSWGPVQINSSDVHLTNSLIRNNRDGVYVAAATTLEGNTITNNTGANNGGVYVAGGGATLTNNTISYNGGPGVQASVAVTLIGNTISHNASYGVSIGSGGGTLTGNTITNNAGYAVSIDANGVKDFDPAGNLFSGNLHDGISISASSYYGLYGDHVWGSWLCDFDVDVIGQLPIGRSGTPGSLSLPADVTLRFTSPDPYYPPNLSVTYGSLTLLPGTTLRFDGGALLVGDTLIAQGTSDHPITFTNISANATGNKWQGLNLDGSATLDHIIVEYTDASWGPVQIYSSDVHLTNSLIRNNRDGIYVAAAVTLEGNTITNNTGANNGGVYVASGGATLTNNTISYNGGPGVQASFAVTLIGNTIANNNGYAVMIVANLVKDSHLTNNILSSNLHDAISIAGSSLAGDHVWGSWLRDYKIDVGGHLVVGDGSTVSSLTLPAGAVLRFTQETYLSPSGIVVRANSNLTARGSVDAPIVLTAINAGPSEGLWGGLDLDTGSSGLLDYVTIEYAVYNHIYSDAVTVSHSTIRHNFVTGFYLYAGATLSDNSIHDNGRGIDLYTSGATVTRNDIYDNGTGINACPLCYGGSGVAVIRHNNIYGNHDLGIQGQGNVDARENWWGSNSGPAPYGSGNGINYATCWDAERGVYRICDYYVDADPWLGKEVSTGAQLGSSGPLSSVQAIIADPVNTANGNYAHQHTDIAIPTRGLPLDFTRAYNSLSPQAGVLGYGWTHNWNLRLTENTTNGSVMIAFADGHSKRWSWTGTAYDGGSGVFGMLVKNGDGSFELTQEDQSRYHFDAGRLAWAEDKNANRTTLAYDGSSRLLTITEPAGRALTLAYASPVDATLISRITDHGARSVQFTYDSASNLEAVTDVTGQITTMTYDADHRLLTMTDANGQSFLRNVYDANNRVSEQYDALDNKWSFAYDEPAHKTLVTDPRGYVMTYQYDSDWRLTGEKDALTYTVSYAYDANNNRTQITDKRGNATHYAYDGRGNPTLITDALNGARSFTYDTTSGRNNLLSETDQRGHTTTYTYDAHSNLTQRTDALAGVTTWAYDGYGQVTSTTDANGHTTTFGYDPLGYGNRTSTSDALGHITAATYDSAGRKLTETDPLGRVTTTSYDATNRVLSITEPLGKLTEYTYDAVGNRLTVTENSARTTHYAYDAKNRLSSVTDPLGHTTNYGYDTVDNQVSITDPLGHATTTTYDALNRRTAVKDALNNNTSYEYDPNGNRTKVTDANGRATLFTYDALNRLTGVTDAAGGAVSYGYDTAGNRTSMTDANSYATTYAYDKLDRLSSATDPLSHVTSYGYDVVGNRTSETRPDGTAVSYTFDAADRLTGVSYPGGSVLYGYNAAGDRTDMTDTIGHTTFVYDDLDRITQIAGPSGTVGYAYDLFNNRAGVTYPGGGTVTYTYDDANRLSTVTDTTSRVTSYAYDDANRLTTVAYPNDVQAAYTYDNADRLLSILHAHATHGKTTSADYTLDAVGNRLTMTDPDGATGYTYDDLYRLTQVAYPDGETVAYSYDPMGNRTSLASAVHGTTTYSYDAADRLLSYAEPGGTVSLSWDDNGRMTGKGSATYVYDPLDRLTQVVDGATTVQFAYDGDGARLRKTVNGTAMDYLQDKAASLPVVLSETTSGGTSRYVYGHDLLEQIDPSDNPTFYHADGLGSVRALSDGTGQRTDAYNYDAFGAVRSRTGDSAQSFAFAGEQGDGELGLIYLRARYFDPDTGRFISVDRMAGLDCSPQSQNKYVYVLNRPTVLGDPTGFYYTYSSRRVAGFWGFGSSLEIAKYVDLETGETRVVLTPGGGAGIGVAASAQINGYSTGNIPGSGFDMRGRLSGELGPGIGVDDRYDPGSDSGSIGFTKAIGIVGQHSRIHSDLSTTTATVVGAGAEASGTANYRFVLPHWNSGGWLDHLLFSGYPNPSLLYRAYSESTGGSNAGVFWGSPPNKEK